MSMFQIKGGFASMVASSRVRLARNVKGYPYQGLQPEQQQEIAQKVWQAIEGAPAIAGEFIQTVIRAGSAEAQAMVERHLISPELAQRGGYLIASKDSGVAIMIGEEDHIRLQVIGEGLCPRECLKEAKRLIALIEGAVPMDFDEQLGYLTACPTNLGTGLRVSVMLHLPMLTAAGRMEKIVAWAARAGCAIRGAFGEGTGAVGGFYQLSNQVTLGLSEEMLADKVVKTATELIESEQRLRQQVREQNGVALEDRICRAAGTLKTARRIPTDEAEQVLSDMLMGLQLGLLSGLTPQDIYNAQSRMLPAALSQTAGKALSPDERDEKRAGLLRTLGDKLTIQL